MKKGFIFLTVLSLFFSLSSQAQIEQQGSDSTIVSITNIEQKINTENFNKLSIVSLNSLTKEEQEKKYENYSPQIIPEYFLLGTIGINKIGNIQLNDPIYSFKKKEGQLSDYLIKLINEELGISVSTEVMNDGRINIFSKELISHIKDFYKKEKASSEGLFKSDEEIFSFLSGIYILHGNPETNESYVLSNNYSDDDLLFSLLRKVGCNKIEYIKYNSIPGNVIFLIIEAPILLKKYFMLFNK